MDVGSTRYGERCSCCPYGYHIDLDFLRYLDTLYSGESLHKSLRRVRHSPRSNGGGPATGDGFFSDDDLARSDTTTSQPRIIARIKIVYSTWQQCMLD